MNLDELNKGFNEAKRKYYKRVARILVSNPDKSYAQLMVEYKLTYSSVLNAVRQEGCKRPRGRRPNK